MPLVNEQDKTKARFDEVKHVWLSVFCAAIAGNCAEPAAVASKGLSEYQQRFNSL